VTITAATASAPIRAAVATGRPDPAARTSSSGVASTTPSADSAAASVIAFAGGRIRTLTTAYS
jgi:hypothetical protein